MVSCRLLWAATEGARGSAYQPRAETRERPEEGNGEMREKQLKSEKAQPFFLRSFLNSYECPGLQKRRCS